MEAHIPGVHMQQVIPRGGRWTAVGHLVNSMRYYGQPRRKYLSESSDAARMD